MKRIIFALLLVSCVRDPYAPPVGYIRDDVYCWHIDADGRWSTRGLSHQCPENTRYGNVYTPLR